MIVLRYLTKNLKPRKGTKEGEYLNMGMEEGGLGMKKGNIRKRAMGIKQGWRMGTWRTEMWGWGRWLLGVVTGVTKLQLLHRVRDLE
jgi:hypothetical protein